MYVCTATALLGLLWPPLSTGGPAPELTFALWALRPAAACLHPVSQPPQNLLCCSGNRVSSGPVRLPLVAAIYQE